MREYFYTDSLEYMWMLRRFGIVCTDGKGAIANPYAIFTSRFYIHPDSLCLLDPQNGDIGKFAHPFYTKWGYYDEAAKDWIDMRTGATINPCPSFQIIERNNIHFMWPQSEEMQYENN